MSHFAEIVGGVVVRVIVAEQDVINGMPGLWVQTSYTGSMRGKYAGRGDLYDAQADMFEPAEVEEP